MSKIVHGAAGQCYCPRLGGAGLSQGLGPRRPMRKKDVHMDQVSGAGAPTRPLPMGGLEKTETPGARKRQPACPGLSAHPTQHFLMESSQGNSSTNPMEKTSLGRHPQGPWTLLAAGWKAWRSFRPHRDPWPLTSRWLWPSCGSRRYRVCGAGPGGPLAPASPPLSLRLSHWRTGKACRPSPGRQVGKDCRLGEGKAPRRGSAGGWARVAAPFAQSHAHTWQLLRHLLEERALQVELRLQEAQSPGQLRARWDGLVQRAEARWGLLEQLVPAARSFEAARSALLALLTPGEQLLAELWQDQLGPEGCKGAVQRLQGVCEGAAARTEGLERALEAGQRLAELLAEDEALLVRGQLQRLRERVRLTGEGAARARQKLLQDLGTESSDPSPLTSPAAQLEPKRAASEHRGLENREQLSAWLAPWTEAPGQAVVDTASIQEPNPPPGPAKPTGVTVEKMRGLAPEVGSGTPAVFRAEVELLGGCRSEAQEQDTRLKVARGPVELAASEEGLQPEGSWAQALQVFPWELWGEWTLSASLLWREPALPGRATGRGTCHLGLLLEPQGCRAMASSSTTERPRVLEGMAMLAAPHFAEELLTLPTRLSQAEPHGPKPGPVARGCGRHSHLLDQAGVVMMALLPGVLRPPSLHQDSECPSDLQVVQARGWGLEEWPVALGAAGLKPWTRAPGKALTLRDPGQGQPEDLRSRTVTRASLGGLLEDLSWRPPQGVGATRRGAGGTRTSGHDVGRGSHVQPPTACSVELARTRVSWPGGHAACNGLATGSTSPPPSRTLWTAASGPGSPEASSSHTAWPVWRMWTGTRTQVAKGRLRVQEASKPGPPPPVPAQVSRGALMVRVGGGWVALDEYLVKYDPGRVKGRTSQKIHERFLSWAVAPSLPAPAVVPEGLWASILCTTGSPLSRKTDWKCAGIRDPISSTAKAE
ncbi:uncharacterized protein [Vicugna pacos]|uniref:Uncharacterized protein isoform X5 n=1 Tax=Vicugna pacos TaxID=30538 RepID=A0ABM5CBM6_VICPA